VAVNGGGRILPLEVLYKLAQGGTLLWGAGITWFKAVIIAAYVADAYGVLVVAGAVGSGLADGATLMD